MKLRAVLICIVVLASLLFGQTVSVPAKGTAPRATADQYPAHAIQGEVQIGAALLTPDDVRKSFAADVNHCCIVVEVALYPQKDHPLDVSVVDFSLRSAGSNLEIKPVRANVVAAKLLKMPPPPSDDHDVTVHGSSGVSYGNGTTDPSTGQRARGHSTTTGASVGVGVGGQQPAEPDMSEQERRTLEMDLSSGSLPEGSATTAVSGYLFFVVSSHKERKAAHQLEYTLNGAKAVLTLP